MRMHLTAAVLMDIGVEIPYLIGYFAPDYAYSSDNDNDNVSVSVSASADLRYAGFGVLTTVGYRI